MALSIARQEVLEGPWPGPKRDDHPASIPDHNSEQNNVEECHLYTSFGNLTQFSLENLEF